MDSYSFLEEEETANSEEVMSAKVWLHIEQNLSKSQLYNQSSTVALLI
jgi:hypothetical protein